MSDNELVEEIIALMESSIELASDIDAYALRTAIEEILNTAYTDLQVESSNSANSWQVV